MPLVTEFILHCTEAHTSSTVHTFPSIVQFKWEGITLHWRHHTEVVEFSTKAVSQNECNSMLAPSSKTLRKIDETAAGGDNSRRWRQLARCTMGLHWGANISDCTNLPIWCRIQIWSDYITLASPCRRGVLHSVELSTKIVSQQRLKSMLAPSSRTLRKIDEITAGVDNSRRWRKGARCTMRLH